jgi:hypothetical protein
VTCSQAGEAATSASPSGVLAGRGAGRAFAVARAQNLEECYSVQAIYEHELPQYLDENTA